MKSKSTIILPLIFSSILVISNVPVKAQGSVVKTFVVSVDGSDTNSGTLSQPMKTLEAARDAARNAGPGNHRLLIMPGEYFLAKQFELDSRDNGLLIEADTSGKVILYGGTRLNAWKSDGGKFWYIDLPEVRNNSWNFRILEVNGRMPERAHIPDSGTFLHKSVFDVPLIQRIGWGRQPTQDELTKMIYDPKDIPASIDIKNAEVRVYNMWTESLVGIEKNDIEKNELTFSTPTLFAMGAFGRKDYIIWNTREGMTRPGRWYLDRTKGQLFYWPLESEVMSNAKIIAPRVERIISINGATDNKAENITIRGLQLKVTNVPLLGAGLRAHAFDGAITITNAKNCNISNLVITNVGGIGIACSDITDSKINNCHIFNTGGGGARLSGINVIFSGNHIHNAGVHYPSAVGLYIRGGNNYHVYRNEIHDITYSGMNIYSDNSLIEENLIYRVMRELHDGAAVYIAGAGNCTIRGNVARDIEAVGSGFGISSYYLDEGCYDCVVENNVSINVTRPVHNHIARNSIIRNNVFICREDLILSFQSSAQFAFENNTLVTPGNIRMVSPNAIKSWKGNRIFSGGGIKNETHQAYTIDSLMPKVEVPERKNRPVKVTWALTAPVPDGEISANEYTGEYYRLDREPSKLPYSGAPVIVKFSYDKKNLYIGAMVMMFDTINISFGDTWGRNDGVEISLEGSFKGKPLTYVLRSYVNGKIQSIADAGAPVSSAERLGEVVRYTPKVMARPTKGWTGEWEIPLKALGLKPEHGQTILFNVCAFVNEYDKWHCWEGMSEENRQIEKEGLLQFE